MLFQGWRDVFCTLEAISGWLSGFLIPFHPFKVGPIEVGPAEVGLAEVSLAEAN
jgi:hypothetical protein